MLTETITEAPWDTIDVAAAKQHLRIFSSDHDVELLATIKEAIAWCEVRSGRTLRTAVEHRTVYGAWCKLGQSLPVQPVLAIEDLTYIDENGDEQIVDDQYYRLIRSAGAAAVIELHEEFDLPTVAARSDAIRLDWSSGYESIDDVPPLAKRAIKVATKLFWGDLDANEVEKWEAAAGRLLSLVEWGSYR